MSDDQDCPGSHCIMSDTIRLHGPARPLPAKETMTMNATDSSQTTPKFPEGTPEYEEYATALRAELKKFANHEPPYEIRPRIKAEVQAILDQPLERQEGPVTDEMVSWHRPLSEPQIKPEVQEVLSQPLERQGRRQATVGDIRVRYAPTNGFTLYHKVGGTWRREAWFRNRTLLLRLVKGRQDLVDAVLSLG